MCALYAYTGSNVSFVNCTIAGNSTSGGFNDGGAIYTYAAVSLSNCTVTNNTAGVGGGIDNVSGSVTLNNTIVAGNTATAGPDIEGTISSGGYNLVGSGSGMSGLTNGSNGNQVGVSNAQLGAGLLRRPNRDDCPAFRQPSHRGRQHRPGTRPHPDTGLCRAYEMQNWTSSGISGGTTSIQPAAGPTGAAQFGYHVNLGIPGSGVSFRTATFSATAAFSGPVSLHYDFAGFHSFFSVNETLKVFADGPGGTTTQTLVNSNPIQPRTGAF